MHDFSEYTNEELVNMYREGEEDALDCIFERFKGVVRNKAGELFITGADKDDAIQEGMIGLYKALRDYDESKDASFATFANLCIKRQILNAVNTSNRKKNEILNKSVSMDSTDENNDSNQTDKAFWDYSSNPESLMMARENQKELKNKMYEVLSAFEKKVLELHLAGMDYNEIANELEKSAKSIDNALQRIRNKVDKITNV